jgi:hypothetical protein
LVASYLPYRRLTLSLCVLAAAGTLAFCMQETLTDVSSLPKFQPLVGAEFELVGNLSTYGIRAHSHDQVVYVTLIPPPGIRGNEVAFTHAVPIGARVKVVSISRSNRVIDNDVTLLVQLSGLRVRYEVPVRVDLFRGNEGEHELTLNPNIYRRLK